jgi:hemolysin activation/secretion protein
MFDRLGALALPLSATLAMVLPVHAQMDVQPTPLPVPAPLPDAPQIEPPPATPSPPVDSTTTFAVNTIQVVGSTVFSAEELAALVAPLEGRTVTLGELQELANALQQQYLEAGYITTQVRIPEQALTDGVVTLEVLEGRLADITVAGADRYNAYVTSRLGLASTDPLSQPELEDQLQLLRTDGLFDDIDAQLQRGEAPGESVLAVRLNEANPFSGRVFVDNYSPRSVGAERIGANLNYRSLAVPGDRLSADLSTTFSGGAQSYSLGYEAPVSPHGSTVRAGFSYEAFRITEADNPAQALGVRGNARVYETEFRHPLIRTPREELGLSVGFRHRDGESVLLDVITVPSRTSVFQFGQDYLRRDGSGAWVARSQFNLGTGLLGATINPAPQADGTFLSWLGQVQRVQVINPDNLLIVRADLQLSGDSLLGSEQFVIGGAQSVRGYTQNARAGDNGFRVSVEDRMVLSRNQAGNPVIQLAPFTDLGAVWFNDPATQPTQQNVLWGAGLGLLANPLPGLDARLDVGIPLVSLNEISDRHPGVQFYFSLGYQF